MNEHYDGVLAHQDSALTGMGIRMEAWDLKRDSVAVGS
jgi:hypothetical protein